MTGLLLWTEVVCAECSTTICGEYARWGKRVAAEIKADLANARWRVMGSDAYCPDCAARAWEEWKEEQNEPSA